MALAGEAGRSQAHARGLRLELEGLPRPEAIEVPRGRGRVTVLDDGPGLSPSASHPAFEPFARGPESSGAGLGIAVAGELACEHGSESPLEARPGARPSRASSAPPGAAGERPGSRAA